MKNLPQISDAEFEVMDIIWKYAPISTNEITDRLAKTKDWSPKTIYTMLSRLEKKGVIVHEKESRVFVYTPCVKKDDYLAAESRTLATRFFDGAMKQMVVSFLDQKDLTPEDLDEFLKLASTDINTADKEALMELPGITKAKVLICAVERGEQEIHIPSGSFRLQAGDRISFVASYAGAQQFFRQMKLAAGRVRSALLIGGGRIAYYLAKQLVEAGLDVKIIESDPERCEELSVLLPKAEILRGDGTNEAFLRECGIETTGAVAALTGIDEENVLIGMYIRKTWPKVKVITKVNRTSFQSIIDSMDLGSVFNPRNSASNLICRYVRAMQNSGSSSQIETLYKLVGGKAEALEFRVSEGSKLCGVPLQELKLRENLLIGCIGRGGQIIIPSGQDAIEPGDSVIVVTCSAGLGRLEDILARGPGHE